jgi:mannose-6-phosphate isomerase-like protein (cupin superfamily)
MARGVHVDMKLIETRGRTRARFAVLARTRSSQAAMMTLPPGAESNEGSANEHAWAEQWLYVVSGTGTARVGTRTVRLRAGSLLLIEKREPHLIRAGRARLVTLNLYVPPAYGDDGEPLRRRARSR